MTGVSIALSCIIVSTFLGLLSAIIQKEKSINHVVKMPEVTLYLGCIFFVIAIILSTLHLFTSLPDVIVFIAIGAGVLAFMFIIMYNSLKIYYTQDSFVVKRIFHKTVEFQYTDIVEVIPGINEGYTLVLRNGKVSVDEFAVGSQDFFDFAEYKYREAGLGICIPDGQQKLFNGYVVDLWPMTILVCIVGALMIGTSIWITVSLYNTPQLDDGNISQINDVGSEQEETETEEGIILRGREAAVFVWSIPVLYWIGVAGSWYILSHAPEHPHLAALLIKKEHRNF